MIIILSSPLAVRTIRFSISRSSMIDNPLGRYKTPSRIVVMLIYYLFCNSFKSVTLFLRLESCLFSPVNNFLSYFVVTKYGHEKWERGASPRHYQTMYELRVHRPVLLNSQRMCYLPSARSAPLPLPLPHRMSWRLLLPQPNPTLVCNIG